MNNLQIFGYFIYIIEHNADWLIVLLFIPCSPRTIDSGRQTPSKVHRPRRIGTLVWSEGGGLHVPMNTRAMLPHVAIDTLVTASPVVDWIEMTLVVVERTN